ncbi:MAG: carboxypeptidase-like regulatory domain-containing protein, partial [Planctomycetota bacterium]
MHRIGALILLAILLGIAWVVLDWNGDSPPDDPTGPGPARPAEDHEPPDATPDSPSPEPGRPVSISGYVLASGGGRAAGARVRPVALGEGWWPADETPRPEVRADAFGRFRLHGLEPGFYRVEARTDDGRGYLPVVPVRAGAPTTVVVRLEEIASISGFVVTEAGIPVAKAKVSADLGGVLRSIQASAGWSDEKRSGQFVAVTDKGGNFRLGDLPVGQYEIQVEAEGHAPRRIPAVNAPVKGIRIEVLDTFEVWGTVDWEGEAKPASIRLAVEPLGLATTVPTREHPAPFRIAGVTRGEHIFRVVSPDYGMGEAKVAVQPGSGTGPVRLTLERGTQVWLHVRKGDVWESRWSRWMPGEEIAADVDAFRVERGLDGDRLVAVMSFPVPKTWRNRIRLTAGEWVLRGRAPGRRTAGAPVRGFSPKEVIWVDHVTWCELVLAPDTRLVGRVTWPSGWPARGIPVEVEGETRVHTDSRGAFRWRGLPLGKAAKVEVQGLERTVTVTLEQPEVRADFVLRPAGTGTVRGQVLSDENAPVPGATVFFRDGFAVTDMDGRFERTDVAAGSHDLRYFAPGYGLGFRADFRVEPGRAVEVPIMVLPWRSGRVSGRVLTESETPVPGARVLVWFPGVTEPLETTTDAGGWFIQEGPSQVEGRATVQVDAPGIGFVRRKVAPGGDPETLEIRLRGTGRMRILIGGRAPAAFRLAVGLEASLASGGDLPKDEIVVVVPEGAEHVDVPGLPPGTYRTSFSLVEPIREGKERYSRLKAKNGKFHLTAGKTVEVGPLT